MNDLKYVFDSTNDDMVELEAAGKEWNEINVFLEHDYTVQQPKSVSFISSNQPEDEREYTYGGYEPEREDGDEDCDDSPGEGDEGDQSNDEEPVAEEGDEIVKENMNANENDDGDDVVLDAGNGANDQRFKTIFEESARTAADFKASQMKDNEENGEEIIEAT